MSFQSRLKIGFQVYRSRFHYIAKSWNGMEILAEIGYPSKAYLVQVPCL